MEALSQYRRIITTVLLDLGEATTQDAVETLSLFDSDHHNYLLLAAGWNVVRRIHHIIAHLRIRNGKIWVEADNTNTEVVQQLLERGVARDAIVLAFYSPQKRILTDFAVA